MIAALLSDTHGYLPSVPVDADLVLHAGDVGIDGSVRDQARWLAEVWFPWIARLDRPVYATWGNHDFIGEIYHRDGLPALPPNLDIVVDAMRTIAGVPVWFSPWSPQFGPWAWMASERDLVHRYAAIPAGTRVIVSHGPPWHAGDRVWDGRHAGSQALADRLAQLGSVEIVVTGHIHEARGTHRCHGARVHNVSCVDRFYRPVAGGPVLCDWPAQAAGAPAAGLTGSAGAIPGDRGQPRPARERPRSRR